MRVEIDPGATVAGIPPTSTVASALVNNQADAKARMNTTSHDGDTRYSYPNHTDAGGHSNLGWKQLPGAYEWAYKGIGGDVLGETFSGGPFVTGATLTVGTTKVAWVQSPTTIGTPAAPTKSHSDGRTQLFTLSSTPNVGSIFTFRRSRAGAGIRGMRVEALNLSSLSVDPASASTYAVVADFTEA